MSDDGRPGLKRRREPTELGLAVREFNSLSFYGPDEDYSRPRPTGQNGLLGELKAIRRALQQGIAGQQPPAAIEEPNTSKEGWEYSGT